MSKQNKKVFSGIVVKALPDTTFRVKLDNGEEIFAYLAGKMRLHYIRVVPGDKVKVEIDAVDPHRGRIIYREK
ncbi:translation initiation factor IF-1 [bacterium]|nr:translation initiation factor IF-1 [bacterium]